MLKTSRKINIFCWSILAFMTIKVIAMLILVDAYNIWLFFSVQTDLIFIMIVFVYSLCKIKGISTRFRIQINKCYMFMHFISVVMLTLTWFSDFAFYLLESKIYTGSEEEWESLSNCKQIKWHEIMYWKAICDMIPTEFVLDLVVLYLILIFAKDSLTSASERKHKSEVINSIA